MIRKDGKKEEVFQVYVSFFIVSVTSYVTMLHIVVANRWIGVDDRTITKFILKSFRNTLDNIKDEISKFWSDNIEKALGYLEKPSYF